VSKTIATIPGLHKYPDLLRDYTQEWRRDSARCGGADCFTNAVVQRYARKLRERQSLEARP
jgi:hypothetical protein